MTAPARWLPWAIVLAAIAWTGRVVALARVTQDAPLPPDFAPFYRGGLAVASGTSPYDLAEIARAPFAGIFKLSPVAGAIMAPLTVIPEPVAALAWRSATLLTMAGAVALLVRAAGWSWRDPRGWLLAALAGASYPLSAEVSDGQFNWIMIVAFCLAAILTAAGRGVWAGLPLGAASWIKLFPAAFGLGWIPLRDWRAILGALAGALLAALVALLVTGPDTWLTWARDVSGDLSATSTWYTNQSLQGVLLRWTGPPVPPLGPALEYGARPSVAVTLLAAAIALPILLWTLWSGWKTNAQAPVDRLLVFSGTVPALLLLFPVTWANYTLFLLPLLAALAARHLTLAWRGPWSTLLLAGAAAALAATFLTPAPGPVLLGWLAFLLVLAAGTAPDWRTAVPLVAIGLVWIGPPEPFGLLDAVLPARGTLGLLLLAGTAVLALRQLPGRQVAPWQPRFAPWAIAALAVAGVAVLGSREAARAAAFPAQPALPSSITSPLDAAFANGIRLAGAVIPSEAVRSGESPVVILAWSTDRPIDDDLTVFVQVYDDQGRACTQNDSQPAGRRFPTFLWVPGEFVIDPHPLEIGPECAPGTYGVHAGLYRLPDVRRVPLQDGGTSVRIGSLVVAP